MRSALEACLKGWGQSIIIGVAAAGQEISTRRESDHTWPSKQHMLLINSLAAFQLDTGRVWEGCAFGGFKGHSQMASLVDEYLQGKLKIDDYITYRKALVTLNEAFELMKQGDCIRVVVNMAA